MEKLQLLISDYIYDITDVGSKTDTYIVLQVSSFSEIYTKTRISFVNDSNERTSSEYPQCNSDLIVKRKLKQSWSIIPPNINILNNHQHIEQPPPTSNDDTKQIMTYECI